MRSRPDTGQSLAEFALVIPIFLVVFLAVLDLGRVVWANNSLANAAREAARFAIVHGGSSTTACPVGPPDPPRTRIPAASASCPFPSPSKQMIYDVARQHAVAGGTAITVTACYGAGCSGDTDAAGARNRRGTPVTVTVTSTVPLAAGAFLGLGNYTVSGTATMYVSH